MDEYVRVRRMREHEGLSVREIARQTGLHRDTIKKMLTQGAPPGYRRRERPARPVLGPFIPLIDQMLEEDRNVVRRKQHHTARRVWERLRDEHGYAGGYTQVRAYVRAARERGREAFVPLSFPPATAQVDWGEALAIEQGQVRRVQAFVMTLPWSDGRFVAAFPRASLEFFLEGHRRAFAFFGGVPRRIIYDNLKSAVVRVGRGRERKLNQTFERFAEHYLLEPRFCNVGRGNEKGHVENGVKWAQRNLFVPMPRFTHWGDFNEQLAQDCRRRQDHLAHGHDKTVGERLAEERPRLLALPTQAAPPGGKDTWTVSSLCLVRFGSNDYSVPCAYAHQRVRVQADVARVRIFAPEVIDGRAPRIATHVRCHGRGQAIYEPLHYLPLLERKPRTLEDGAPMQQLQATLPESFAVLRRRLEADQEAGEGTRQFIAVLMLLADHSVARLTRAVERALELGMEHPEAIKNLLLCPPEATPGPLDLSGLPHLARYALAPPSLAAYGALATAGGGDR